MLTAPLKLLLDVPVDAFGRESANARKYILEQLGLAAAGCSGVVYMVNVMGEYCRRKQQTGKDLCKKGTPLGEVPIPESQGLAPGIIYLIIIIACQLLYTQSPESLANYNSSLLSICFMLFLGFVDDVLDLPWRFKLILPPIATLPLLCSYSGSTSVIIPKPLRGLLWRHSDGGGLTPLGQLLSLFVTIDGQAQGKIVELGLFFMIYMALLAVFCTNAINIYAGINGLEAGQSLVIAVGVLAFTLTEILYENDGKASPTQVLSLTLVLPFIGVVLGLLYHNFYPARAFVGDTFCYFAGMTFAVIGVHGHFSKTLCFLFLPQIANFLLSLPQLFKIVPCPRHRLPRVDPSLDRLLPSLCPCASEEHRWAKRLFGLPPDSDHFINLTLINAVLRVVGPLHERTLCLLLLLLQVVCCLGTMFLRFYLANMFT
ncbi:UDP-N-acetylglucosamine--dolichyl-phosphate N-acetylglucosaminephosphotransferase [Nannochloropsis gaditana CCMP526]|nr:UDP-N-acetylglucosamine--dolichyl-phosphate N-acetylglucosaminephosphotransferase [Nannochloropsis gaditana CCMP526]EKU22148.1 UDP-N-acetylglucosamine--dolichyl-phosphate N-acetylglucosaminephosphotransferase [Nannochloropsis gaditana CCMP526]|eukprot:XP_005854209.1 UDP-N-acetylglucosamine--dolichyl-phosphate N-acetylglucosaminephosphotransferase [Nannochloropsis gaditana CCMP526]